MKNWRKKKCSHCNKEYESFRPESLYCGNSCRQQACNARKEIRLNKGGEIAKKETKKEIFVPPNSVVCCECNRPILKGWKMTDRNDVPLMRKTYCDDCYNENKKYAIGEKEPFDFRD